MRRRNAHSLRPATWQAPLIVLIAAVAALTVNALRSQGRLPLTSARPPAAGDDLRISLDQARELFRRGTAIFVDARPRRDYLQGHIRGALSLPWQEVDERIADVADRLTDERVIITYCDGERCTLSHHLARYLVDMGYPRVRVLANGWTRWRQSGLPVARGAGEARE